MIDAKTKLYCIIGNPVDHSLSPQMHNAAFRKLKLNNVFLAFKIESIRQAIAGLKDIGCRGIVVTVPFKEKVIEFLDDLDKAAEKIGAVNAVRCDNGKLTGTNTDWTGAIKCLEEKTDLKDKRVAVLGAGGASRAVIYGLKQKGAKVVLLNRTVEKAEKLAAEFNLQDVYPLSDTSGLKDADIIINTTSVGMHPDDNASPIPGHVIGNNQTVFDIVYTPHWTALLKSAADINAQVVFGYKMVLYGGAEIFRFFTGVSPPFKVMENALKKHLL